MSGKVLLRLEVCARSPEVCDEVAAINALPDLSPRTSESAKATGTDDASAATDDRESVLALRLAHRERLQATQDDAGGRNADSDGDAETLQNKGKTAKRSGGGGIRTHGDPEGHAGFQDRCIQPLCHPTDVV